MIHVLSLGILLKIVLVQSWKRKTLSCASRAGSWLLSTSRS